MPTYWREDREAALWWQESTRSPDANRSQRADELGDGSEEGAYLYQTFCGGCHGFSGIAFYYHSPSFALGERLEKPDTLLIRSVAEGIRAMPGWGAMLTQAQIEAIVIHIRTLESEYRQSIGQPLSVPPALYFRFVPYGEGDSYWQRHARYRLAVEE